MIWSHVVMLGPELSKHQAAIAPSPPANSAPFPGSFICTDSRIKAGNVKHTLMATQELYMYSFLDRAHLKEREVLLLPH